MFFVVDGINGVTIDDHSIAAWLKKHYLLETGCPTAVDKKRLLLEEGPRSSESKELTVSEKSSPPGYQISRPLQIRLLVNKSDNGENLDIINDLYALGMGDPLFVSSTQGDGMVRASYPA